MFPCQFFLEKEKLPVWTGEFGQIRLVEPAWLKAGLHSFFNQRLARPAMKTCSCGRPARKTCQKSAHASNFHFQFIFFLCTSSHKFIQKWSISPITPDGSTPQQRKIGGASTRASLAQPVNKFSLSRKTCSCGRSFRRVTTNSSAFWVSYSCWKMWRKIYKSG